MNWIATLLGVSLMITALPIASAVAQQAPATPTSPQAILVGSDSLVGGTVRDNEGRDIGKVSRLMIDPNDGRITSIVIATGGTLGVGSNTISVPWSLGEDRAGPRQGDRDREPDPRERPGSREHRVRTKEPAVTRPPSLCSDDRPLSPDRRRNRGLLTRRRENLPAVELATVGEGRQATSSDRLAGVAVPEVTPGERRHPQHGEHGQGRLEHRAGEVHPRREQIGLVERPGLKWRADEGAQSNEPVVQQRSAPETGIDQGGDARGEDEGVPQRAAREQGPRRPRSAAFPRTSRRGRAARAGSTRCTRRARSTHSPARAP